jgi:hypothetical protein
MNFLLDYCRFCFTRRFRRTGGPTEGRCFSQAKSSDSSAPGMAKGLIRRSGNLWFFANRLIESSLNPKSFAISGSCSHRSMQPVMRCVYRADYTPGLPFFLTAP